MLFHSLCFVVVIVVLSLLPKYDDACVECSQCFYGFFGFLEVISKNLKQTPIRLRLSEHIT